MKTNTFLVIFLMGFLALPLQAHSEDTEDMEVVINPNPRKMQMSEYERAVQVHEDLKTKIASMNEAIDEESKEVENKRKDTKLQIQKIVELQNELSKRKKKLEKLKADNEYLEQKKRNLKKQEQNLRKAIERAESNERGLASH